MNENKSVDSTVFEQAMKALLSKVDSTEKFVLEQAPEVCRQLVAEKSLVFTMNTFLGLGMFAVGTVLSVLSAKAAMGEFPRYSNVPVLFTLGSIITGLMGLLGFSGLYMSIESRLRLKIAPKIFLLREFGKIVSGKSGE